MATFLMLLSHPLVRFLAERRVPRRLSSVALAIVAAGTLFGLGWLDTERVLGMVDTA